MTSSVILLPWDSPPLGLPMPPNLYPLVDAMLGGLVSAMLLSDADAPARAIMYHVKPGHGPNAGINHAATRIGHTYGNLSSRREITGSAIVLGLPTARGADRALPDYWLDLIRPLLTGVK